MNDAAREIACIAGCALVAFGTAGAAGAAFASPALQQRLRARADALARQLRYLQIRADAVAIVRLALCAWTAAALASLALVSPWPLALALAGQLGVRAWLQRACQRRTTAIEAQLDSLLLVLANAVRANPALSGALAASAELVARPLACELEVALREHELGLPLDQALARIAERAGSAVAGAAFAILNVARETGGDLSHTLETAAASLREMARLEGVVRTKTAEGRAQTAAIAIAPLLLVGLLDEIDPEFLAPLWSAPLGQTVAAAAAGLWAGALLLARRIVAVDI